jgi:hypothetical protein
MDVFVGQADTQTPLQLLQMSSSGSIIAAPKSFSKRIARRILAGSVCVQALVQGAS